MNVISVRVHQTGEEIMLAACDFELLDSVFKQGKMRLAVSREFYESMEIEGCQLLEMLKKATIANLVGVETVGVAVEGGFVDEECIIYVEEIPHAQMVIYGG